MQVVSALYAMLVLQVTRGVQSSHLCKGCSSSRKKFMSGTARHSAGLRSQELCVRSVRSGRPPLRLTALEYASPALTCIWQALMMTSQLQGGAFRLQQPCRYAGCPCFRIACLSARLALSVAILCSHRRRCNLWTEPPHSRHVHAEDGCATVVPPVAEGTARHVFVVAIPVGAGQ